MLPCRASMCVHIYCRALFQELWSDPPTPRRLWSIGCRSYRVTAAEIREVAPTCDPCFTTCTLKTLQVINKSHESSSPGQISSFPLLYLLIKGAGDESAVAAWGWGQGWSLKKPCGQNEYLLQQTDVLKGNYEAISLGHPWLRPSDVPAAITHEASPCAGTQWWYN